MGKTALIEEFLKKEVSPNIVHLKVMCNEIWGDGISPFIDSLVNFYEELGVRRVKRVIEKIFVETAENSGIFGTILKNILETKDVKLLLPELKDEVARQAIVLYYGYLRTLIRIAGRKTLFLWIEDSQWLDMEGMKLLAFLGEKVRDKRILIIATYRSGYITTTREENARKFFKKLEEKGNIWWLKLEGLEEGEVAQLLTLELEGVSGLTKRIVKSLSKRTKGNPYLLKAITRFLVLDGAIQKQKVGYKIVKPIALSSIPKSIERVVLKQLKKAYSEMPDAKRMLDTASVIGEQFEVSLLSGILSIAERKVCEQLREIEDRYAIVQEIIRSVLFSFEHAIIQEVIYHSLGIDATRLHKKIAHFLIKQMPTKTYEIAYHLKRASLYDKAAIYLVKTINEYNKHRLFSTVTSLCEEYFDLVGPMVKETPKSEEIDIQLIFCEALYKSARHDEAIPILHRLLTYTSLIEERKLITALKVLGQCYYHMPKRSYHFKAVSILEGALKHAEKSKLWELAGHINITLAPAYDKVGRDENARESYKDSIKLMKRAISETKTNQEKIDLQIFMADIMRRSCMFVDSSMNIEMMNAALSIFRQHGIKFEMARCLTNIGAEYFYIGSFNIAIDNLLEAKELFEEVSDIYMSFPLNNLGLVHMAQGNVSKALKLFLKAKPLCREHSDLIYVQINIATAYRLLGDLNNALATMKSIESQVVDYGEEYMLDHFYFNLAMIYFDMRKYNKAINVMRKVPPHTFRVDNDFILGKRMKYLGKAYASLGRHLEAKKATEKAKRFLSSTRPQKWYYDVNYYPCEIELWSS